MKQKLEQGFTLVELVIGVFLLAVLAAAGTGIFTTLTTGYRLTVPVGENNQNTQAALNFMTREIRGGNAFNGVANRINFTNADGQSVSYFLTADNQLVRRIGGVDTPLANNINNLAFAYNGASNQYSLITIQVNGMTQNIRPRSP